MRTLRTTIVVLVVALGFLGGYFVGWYVHGENVTTLSSGQRSSAKQAGALQQRILEELQGRYYKAVDVNKLSAAGVNGTLVNAAPSGFNRIYTFIYVENEDLTANLYCNEMITVSTVTTVGGVSTLQKTGGTGFTPAMAGGGLVGGTGFVVQSGF